MAPRALLEEGHVRMQVWTAVASNNLPELKRLLDNVDLPERDNTDFNLTHRAVEGNFVECLRLLLNRGANINARDRIGDTAAHYAAERGHKACLQLLLEQGASVNASDNDGDTPLHYAAFFGSTECLVLLIEWGADVTVCTSAGYTPLHYAARNGNVDAVKALLEAGANPYARNSQGQTPRSMAAYNWHTETLRVMRAMGPMFPPSLKLLCRTAVRRKHAEDRHLLPESLPQEVVQFVFAWGSNGTAQGKVRSPYTCAKAGARTSMHDAGSHDSVTSQLEALKLQV